MRSGREGSEGGDRSKTCLLNEEERGRKKKSELKLEEMSALYE